MLKFLKSLKKTSKEKIPQSSETPSPQENRRDLVNVLRQTLSQKEIEERMTNELREAERLAWEREYTEKYGADIATSFILSVLNDNRRGEKETVVQLLNNREELESYTVKEYITDSETLEILREYIDDSFGNSEGYRFTIYIDPDFSKIHAPCCYCENVSDTFTIKGNRMDSNCDTWGTAYRQKAESIYFFYLEDVNKKAAVKVRYWVM